MIDGVKINERAPYGRRDRVVLEKQQLAQGDKEFKLSREAEKALYDRQKGYAQQFKTGFYQSREFYTPQYDRSEPVEVRDDFRPTIYWNPSVNVDRRGKAKLSFYTSDALTTFRVTVEGFARDGGIGQGVGRFFNQKTIGMRTKLPTQLLTEDEFMIPVAISNNSNKDIRGRLNIQLPEGIRMTKTPGAKHNLSAGETKTVYVHCRADLAMTDAPIAFSFATDETSDATAETISVKSRGFPVSEVFADNQVEKTFVVNVNEPIAESVQAQFSVYPSLLGDLVTGAERMLRQPTAVLSRPQVAIIPIYWCSTF